MCLENVAESKDNPCIFGKHPVAYQKEFFPETNGAWQAWALTTLLLCFSVASSVEREMEKQRNLNIERIICSSQSNCVG